jgi:hypothetical protein
MASIPYANVIDRRAAAVDAQDVVTEARIVIAGDYQGNAATATVQRDPTGGGASEFGDVYPWPIVHARIPDTSANTTYRAQRSFKLPENVNPFKAEADSVNLDNEGTHVNISNSTNAYDGDAATAATNTAAGAATYILNYINHGISTTIGEAWGLVLRYTLDEIDDTGFATPPFVRLTHFANFDALQADDIYSAIYEVPLVVTDEPRNIYMVGPRDARASTINLGTPAEFNGFDTEIRVFANCPNIGGFQIHSVHGLVLDTDVLDGIADAQVKIPAVNPKEVTVDYHVPIEAEHTITGWPGGDLTADVARQKYVEGTTVIEFEQSRRSLGVSLLEREEARRVRQETFPVTMGTRR